MEFISIYDLLEICDTDGFDIEIELFQEQMHGFKKIKKRVFMNDFGEASFSCICGHFDKLLISLSDYKLFNFKINSANSSILVQGVFALKEINCFYNGEDNE